jgi:hypothetical protein
MVSEPCTVRVLPPEPPLPPAHEVNKKEPKSRAKTNRQKALLKRAELKVLEQRDVRLEVFVLKTAPLKPDTSKPIIIVVRRTFKDNQKRPIFTILG